MYHHYFDPRILALQEELQHHPDLLTILAVQTDTDPYIHIAEIAAYCKMALDGDYTQEDIHAICERCCMYLKKKREVVVITG